MNGREVRDLVPEKLSMGRILWSALEGELGQVRSELVIQSPLGFGKCSTECWSSCVLAEVLCQLDTHTGVM